MNPLRRFDLCLNHRQSHPNRMIPIGLCLLKYSFLFVKTKFLQNSLPLCSCAITTSVHSCAITTSVLHCLPTIRFSFVIFKYFLTSGKSTILEAGLAWLLRHNPITPLHNHHLLAINRNPVSLLQSFTQHSFVRHKFTISSYPALVLSTGIVRDCCVISPWQHCRMSFHDFCNNFTVLEICHLGPDAVDEHRPGQWVATRHEGRWVRGSNAGGRKDRPSSEFLVYTQYVC